MENIVAALFAEESKGYQAITELKKKAVTENYAVMQMALIKRDGNNITVLDGFDSGLSTADDTIVGGLVGAVVGILGGPIGVLFMGAYGALLGTIIDTGDAATGLSLLEVAAQKLGDKETALIAFTSEKDEKYLDEELTKYDCAVVRFDAAVIAKEVEEADKLQAELDRQARQALREQRMAEHQAGIEEERAKIAAEFEELKSRYFD